MQGWRGKIRKNFWTKFFYKIRALKNAARLAFFNGISGIISITSGCYEIEFARLEVGRNKEELLDGADYER
ncbi:MAG: hypothetical protein MR911_10115 [Spirochaetia bacterium]|nr:hypothetical protein [Spirochaetia bacterium]